MKNETRNYQTVLILILFFILAGCSSDSSSALYNKSAKEFNNTYFKVVENIDVSNTLKSLERIQTEENVKDIDKLGKLTYTKFESLSIDDKIRINSIIISIDLEKKNWKDKHSTIIWD